LRLKKQIRQRLSRLSFLLQRALRMEAPAMAANYSEMVQTRLRQSRHTASLGARLRGESYDDLGRSFFERLKEYGLKTDQVCVDYGCGTLRVGRHVIRYLDRDAYWGLDIDAFLLEEGRKLLGEELIGEKRPNLRVISSEAVAEAAAARPTMLFSTKVLSHVPPTGLKDYFGNIISIIGASGHAIVMSRWSEAATFRCNKWIWAHSIEGLDELVSGMGGKLSVLVRKPGVGRNVTSGTFEIVPLVRPVTHSPR
jgi:hypothetical protein